MKLVEMGKVNLDVSVTEYLPRFRMQDKRYKQITLRTCLNHSSGLPGANLKYSFSTKWLTEDIYEEFYDYFSKSKLKDTPGNNSVYCNDGYILAEMVVAEVSGISFIQFVQDHIAKPVGALSTFSGGNIPENRVRVKEKEKKEEYIMCTGSGGIITNIIDCAKIGYLFIDPKEVFKPESLHETTLSQGKSVITGIAENFGLGWDSVNFSLEPYDFGENVLVKSGATNMFRTFLLVSPKYKLAAAISVTNDNRIVVYDILSELCSLLLDEYNINTRKKKKEKEFDIEKSLYLLNIQKDFQVYITIILIVSAPFLITIVLKFNSGNKMSGKIGSLGYFMMDNDLFPIRNHLYLLLKTMKKILI